MERQKALDKVLLYSVVAGEYELVALALQKGASSNSHDLHGVSALHIAVHNNRADLVELLLIRGANRNSTSRRGNSVRQWAQENNLQEILSLLDTPIQTL